MSGLNMLRVRRDLRPEQVENLYPGLTFDPAQVGKPIQRYESGFPPDFQVEGEPKSATEVMQMLDSMGKLPKPMGSTISTQPKPQEMAQAAPAQAMPAQAVEDPITRLFTPRKDATEAYEETLRYGQGQLQNLRDIAEGFGNARAYTAGDILFGLHKTDEPFVAEGIRANQERLDQMLLPSEAKAAGIQFAPGMTRAIAPLAAQNQRQTIDNAHDQKMRELGMAHREKLQGDEIAAQMAMNAADNEATIARAQGSRQPVIDAKTTEKIRALDDMLKMADELEAEKRSRWTGPLDSRVSKFNEMLGLNPGGAGFRQKVHALFYQKLVSNAGLSQTASEVANTKELMPQVTDNDNVFDIKLENIRGMLRRERDSIIGTQGHSGRNVGGFQGMLDLSDFEGTDEQKAAYLDALNRWRQQNGTAAP